uniref:Hexameric tyrosine-coordinated heme protein n=1 Tax=Roseihalotalea indica TaxID=2867963 RepID=A0AA49GM90_9BACT|nr:hexameric tyrosine-coordinated heme protein [Tunicatimonas sp. TK19036]
MEKTENYLPSLITKTPMEGRELAIKLARKSIAAIQTDEEMREKPAAWLCQ